MTANATPFTTRWARAPHQIRKRPLLIVLAALACAGCAASAPDLQTGSLNPGNGKIKTVAAEQSCGKRTGRMQIRILELRAAAPSSQSSALSRTLQGLVTPIFGGPSGNQQSADRVHKIADLERDNAALRAAGCPAFDIARELAVTDTAHTPRPQ